MKKPLLLAALAFASPLAFALDASAQTYSPSGSTDPNMTTPVNRMFIINAATPGALTFAGSGTATFNNSIGTSNQFNVGSSTSLGVNASVSATPELGAMALGNMQLASGSNLMQTNGTASQAANAQAAAEIANTVATDTAISKSHQQGWEAAQTATGIADTKAGSFGSYTNSGRWSWNDNYYGQTHTAVGKGESEWKAEVNEYRQFKNAYSTTYNENYNDNYASAYSNVVKTTSSSSSGSSQTGVITGTFKSIEDSVSSVGQGNTMSNIINSALAAADKAGPRTTNGVENAAWTSAFNAAYSAGYQNAVGTVKSTSTSDVSITGLGAIASVNTADTSKFNVVLDRLEAYTAAGSQENSTATANGSANSSLSTNSFATQQNSRTASAFMQAFAPQ